MIKKFHNTTVLLLLLVMTALLSSCGQSSSGTDGGESSVKAVGSVSVSSGSASLIADSASSTKIRVVVLDTEGNPKSGTAVNFTTTHGSITATVSSDATGIAEATLTATSNLGTTTVTAEAGGIVSSTSVAFVAGPPDQITIEETFPANLTADGTSQSTVTVTVFDANNNPVQDGETITFQASNGTLNNLTSTTIGGKTSVTYTSPNFVPAAGYDVITATATNGKTSSTNITLIGQQIAAIAIGTSASSAPADGTSQTSITADITVAGGDSAPDGTTVNFSIISGGGTITPTATTSGGQAIAILTSPSTPGQAIIRIEAGGRISETTVTYTPGSVTLTATPNTMLGTGAETATVTATLKKADNTTPAAGETVTFTVDNLNIGTLSSASATSDASGEATVNFNGDTLGGSATVTATWNTSGVDISGTTTITIHPPPRFIEGAAGSPNPAEISIKGTGGNSTSQITFDVKDAQGQPVMDGYRIDFSLNGNPLGGEEISPFFATTSNGQVSTILQSGFRSGPVSIKAAYHDDTSINTSAGQISIAGGHPVGEEFGISGQYLNISGLNIAWLEDTISVNAGDIYGNSVPDKTTISFKTNNTGGMFDPGSAGTTNGGASSTLFSVASPTPLDGFVSVTAEAIDGGRTTHVTSIAINPQNTDVLFIGTDGGGIYKSSDGGSTWSNISSSSTSSGQNWLAPFVNDVVIDPENPNTIYAATGNLGNGHIYRSLDGGASWNSNNVEEWNGLLATPGAVRTLICDETSDYVWAGTNGFSLYRSTNGEDFTQTGVGTGLSTTVNDLIKVSGTGATAVLYAATPTGVFKSTDGGANWSETGNFFQDNVITLEIYPAQLAGKDIIYAGTEDNGIWVSTDSGANWTQHSNGIGYGLSASLPEPNYNNTGTGVISSVTVGTAAISENWSIICTSETADGGTFTVAGDISGPQTAQATVDSLYTSDNGEISFTIQDGSVDFKPGDTFTFFTVRDDGRNIKDILVDSKNELLYLTTYFWGTLEPHAVGSVYVHTLNADGTMTASAWQNASADLPLYDPPGDSTRLAQHVLAADDPTNPSSLYLGGEGISMSRATQGLVSGSPDWFSSSTGITNKIMARMPILFTGDQTLTILPSGAAPNIVYTIYVQDQNGNPPISGSSLTVTHKDSNNDTESLFQKTYGDALVHDGTYRDTADPSTDIPFVVSATVVAGDEVTITFTPYCSNQAPGCSGSTQSKTYRY
jgi:hypothetical protein